MRRVASSIHLWISLGLLAVFCAGATSLDNRTALMLSNALLLVVSAVVGFAYVPVAFRAIRDGEPASIQHLSIGIVFAWCGGAAWRLLSILWLTSGQPPELVNNDIVSGMQALIALGALYHLTAPGAIGYGYRSRSVAVGVVIVGAFAFAGWMIFAPPDTRAIAQAIIPYLPR